MASHHTAAMNGLLERAGLAYRVQDGTGIKDCLEHIALELVQAPPTPSDEEASKVLELLATLQQQIRTRNAHWQSCQDGSYECAMHGEGYYAIERVREFLRPFTRLPEGAA